MRLKDFDYFLPKNLIAQYPIKPRDHSRLLVLGRKSGKIKHKHFYNIADYLKKGDVLVLNNSKVFPARLIGKKAKTGGKIEVFLLRKVDIFPSPFSQQAQDKLLAEGGEGYYFYSPLARGRLRGGGEFWPCLIGGHGRKEGLMVEFNKGLKAEVIKNNQDGTWLVWFNKKDKETMKIVEKIGRVPLPPYIKRQDSRKQKTDNRNYQTVYADKEKCGSVAAPTAGFHFTKDLIKKLKKKGVQFEYVTLHVGLGTFAPVKANNITKHKMHAEWVEVKRGALKRIIKAKKDKRRIIAVGTTSVRALETIFNQIKKSCELRLPASARLWQAGVMSCKLCDFSGWTNIFIYPGYKFKAVDGLVTNFHLPKSTLLMLVCAFSNQKKIFKAYQEAIKRKYRFYSYGDAMFII